MYVCPKGHQSQASDYCDECGAAIAGGRSNSAAGTATPAPASTPASTPSSAPCPDCDSPRTGRFCEVCGYDFLLAKLGTAAKPGADPDASGAAEVGTNSTMTGAGAQPAAESPAPESPVAESPAPESPAPESPASGDGGVAVPDPGSLPRRTPADANGTTSWVLVVNADAAYHARMQAQAEPDAEPIALPAFVPARRFILAGAQALIGRRSRSRGIEPEIDLSGPPADSAVSHAHALLLAGPDGSWAVVDLESANGTYVNEDPDPIPPNAPCQLSDGDRIHLGAWTTITLGHPA